jgi:hypothetical protein
VFLTSGSQAERRGKPSGGTETIFVRRNNAVTLAHVVTGKNAAKWIYSIE